MGLMRKDCDPVPAQAQSGFSKIAVGALDGSAYALAAPSIIMRCGDHLRCLHYQLAGRRAPGICVSQNDREIRRSFPNFRTEPSFVTNAPTTHQKKTRKSL